jgi:hypothetical protein
MGFARQDSSAATWDFSRLNGALDAPMGSVHFLSAPHFDPLDSMPMAL